MDIPFRFQSDSQHYAFVMSFEHEQIAASCDSDIARITIPARFKRLPTNDNQQQELYPVVLELHGRLFRANAPFEWGAMLLPPDDLPIALVFPGIEAYVNLSFAFSKNYLQQLEDQRASQPGQNILLAIRLSGVAAVMKNRNNNAEGNILVRPVVGELVRYENVRTEFNSPPTIRIARSDWIDTFLPNLGYRRNVIIELPLIRTPAVPQAYQMATSALEKAQDAFNHEDYRGAMKYGREVLEHLGKSSSDGSGKLTSFCKEYLEPFIGETKSNTVERSLNALREITYASSHADPQKPFLVDRTIAAYLIEALALHLRYISSVQG